AWAKLTQIAREGATPDLLSLGRAADGTVPTGLYAREFQITPGALPWVLGNRHWQPVSLDLTYRPGNGLTLSGPQRVTLAPRRTQSIPLLAYHSGAPGVYDGLVEGRVRGQSTPAVQYPATVIVPHEFNPIKGHIINGIKGTLGPARYGRHFVRVPEGTTELSIQLTIPENKGRVRLMLYTPDGLPHGLGSPWAGAPEGPAQQSLTVSRPQPGVWEINTYASHGAMNWNLAENHYRIDVAARGVYAAPRHISLNGIAGGSLSQLISFTNSYKEILATTTGAGFVQPTVEEAEVEDGSAVVKFFEVKESTALIRTAIEEAGDPDAHLSLSLYYRDEAAGGWVKVGRRTGRAGVQELEWLNPAPGTYALEILGNRVPAGKSSLKLSQTIVTEGGEGISPPDTVAVRSFGATWNTRVHFQVPSTPGFYTGAVILKDGRSGKILSVVPVDVRP
ncbi:MAG: hypothetical protein ACOY94_12895, partial [Bacillota bacterium]